MPPVVSEVSFNHLWLTKSAGIVVGEQGQKPQLIPNEGEAAHRSQNGWQFAQS